MTRLSPISREQVAEQHQGAFDEVTAAPGGIGSGPTSILKNSPEMARRAMHLSDYLRNESSLPKKVQDVEGPSEVALIGDEAEVERQLRAYADAGVTDFLASIFPVGEDEEASLTRTTSLLKGLVGRLYDQHQEVETWADWTEK